jgi:hypothetical protein
MFREAGSIFKITINSRQKCGPALFSHDPSFCANHTTALLSQLPSTQGFFNAEGAEKNIPLPSVLS